MTMTAAEVLVELRGRGVTLEAQGGRLRFSPVGAVPPPLVEELRRNKAALLALVGEPVPVVCFACHGADFWQGPPIHYRDGSARPAPWVCSRCHPRPGGERQEAPR